LLQEWTAILTAKAQTDLLLYGWSVGQASPLVCPSDVGRLKSVPDRPGAASDPGRQRTKVRPGLRIIGFGRRVTIACTVEPGKAGVLRLSCAGRNRTGPV
jgi:toxin ParE1/3/4